MKRIYLLHCIQGNDHYQTLAFSSFQRAFDKGCTEGLISVDEHKEMKASVRNADVLMLLQKPRSKKCI